MTENFILDERPNEWAARCLEGRVRTSWWEMHAGKGEDNVQVGEDEAEAKIYKKNEEKCFDKERHYMKTDCTNLQVKRTEINSQE